MEVCSQKKLKEQAAERGLCLVVPPSTQTRVKVPVTLHKMMEECNEPLVGLSYITEVIDTKKSWFISCVKTFR